MQLKKVVDDGTTGTGTHLTNYVTTAFLADLKSTSPGLGIESIKGWDT